MPLPVTSIYHTERPQRLFCQQSEMSASKLGQKQIGIVNKIELDKIIKIILASSAMSQCRNTSLVIKWFQNLLEKNKSKFLRFDIIDFYLSITEKLLKNAILFAKKFTAVSDDTIEIILNAFFCFKLNRFFSSSFLVRFTTCPTV